MSTETNDVKRDRGRHGRGRGRNRGRGVRGRGRGRGTGPTIGGRRNKTANPQDLSPDSTGTTVERWIQESLQNLGHDDPSSVSKAWDVIGGSKEADEQFERLSLWLEDRLIRIWDLKERESLRNDFWNHIDNYLEAIECPRGFRIRRGSEDFNGDDSDWRALPTLRVRVINWMMACATSEAFGDMSDGQQRAICGEPATTAPTAIDEATLQSPSKRESTADSLKRDMSKFPLGLSTGDEEVDYVLSILRMKLLMSLENDQKRINDAISEMQRVTAEKSKRLKETKLRPHNAESPAPKKSNNRKSGQRR